MAGVRVSTHKLSNSILELIESNRYLQFLEEMSHSWILKVISHTWQTWYFILKFFLQVTPHSEDRPTRFMINDFFNINS